jgi:hypothetical protein
MKRALIVLATMVSLACSQDLVENVPTAPNVPTIPPIPLPAPPIANIPAWVSVMVVDDSGICIPNAKVEIVRGQGAGRSGTHDKPCAQWDYGFEITFNNLIPGVEMTLRAAAPGYKPVEKTIRPTSESQMALLFSPIRVP